MPDTVTSGWWSEIRRRARERDVERLVWYNGTRKATLAAWMRARASGAFPELLPEYIKVLFGALLGFWLLALGLSYFFHAQKVYTYAVLAMVFSLQASYYKRQLAKNPDFKVRRCNCAGARKDSTENVLKSDASTTLGVTNSTLAAVLYGALLALLYSGHTRIALFASAAAVLASAYLAYVMITRVKGLCSTCINVAALNVLLLWQLS